jgi:hypothetical protein
MILFGFVWILVSVSYASFSFSVTWSIVHSNNST